MRWVGAALLVVGLVACGGGKKAAGAPSYGSGLYIPTEAPSGPTGSTVPAAGSGAGSFTVSFVSSRGVPVPGLPVAVAGPRSQTATTDEAGNVALTVPPGVYTLTPGPCAPMFFIQHSGTARVTVPPGAHVSGRLQMGAETRVVPARPSDYQRVTPPEPVPGADAHWRVDQVYRVTFATQDRCTGRPAAGESLSGLRFVPGPGYALVGPPAAAADRTGIGMLEMTCLTPHHPQSLVVVAAADPSDRADLFDFNLLDRPEPDCGP